MAAESPILINAAAGSPAPTPVAMVQDAALNKHQQVVLETWTSPSDPSPVNGANPLPVNVTAGVVAASADNSAFTPNTQPLLPFAWAGYTYPPSAVSSGNLGAAAMTLLRQPRIVLDANIDGGCSTTGFIAPATPALQAIKAAGGKVFAIHATNSSANMVYLKFWNILSGSVTLGTTAAAFQFGIPGNAAGAGFVLAIAQGRQFSTAITCAVTGAISLTDNTAITGSAVNVTIDWL